MLSILTYDRAKQRHGLVLDSIPIIKYNENCFIKSYALEVEPDEDLGLHLR